MGPSRMGRHNHKNTTSNPARSTPSPADFYAVSTSLDVHHAHRSHPSNDDEPLLSNDGES
ncbi:unnamed protein product [Amoebophrya sp. A25]|nr:unnamed protein product [Amoebophrya sp. A25]|eukprot:GSA25T00014539001.1